MLRIFMAPLTEPGRLTLQADQGTWHAAIAMLDQANELPVAQAIRAELGAQGFPPPRSLRLQAVLSEAGTGPVLRVKLPEPQGRTVLRVAGVSA